MSNEPNNPTKPKPTPKDLRIKSVTMFAIAGSSLLFLQLPRSLAPNILGDVGRLFFYGACALGALAGLGYLIAAAKTSSKETTETSGRPVPPKASSGSQDQFVEFKVQVCTQMFAFARLCGRATTLEEIKRFVDNYFATLPAPEYEELQRDLACKTWNVLDKNINKVRKAFLST
jgi:hypothetical protein